MADTFGEDPRWTDYITEVRCGDNPTVCRATYSFVTEPVLGEFEKRARGFLSSGWSN